LWFCGEGQWKGEWRTYRSRRERRGSFAELLQFDGSHHGWFEEESAASDLIKMRGSDMLTGNFKAKGPLKNNVKDMDLILETARNLQVVLPLAALYQQFQLKAFYKEWGACDATVVMKIYEEMAECQNNEVHEV
jgi:hypothetical protein